MRLLVAWIVSALAGAAVYPIGLCGAIALLGDAPWGWGLAMSIIRLVPYVFVACLLVQLVYGGLLYALLGSLGWLNLPVVLLAYVIPVAALAAMSDVPKDAIMQIPKLICGTALAIVGLLLARA